MQKYTYEITWKTQAQLETILRYMYRIGYKHFEDNSLDEVLKYYWRAYKIIELRPDKTFAALVYSNVKPAYPNVRAITLDELFALEQPDVLEVKLNDNHTATVTHANITVGCQTFTHEAIKELYEASVKLSS